MNRRTFVRVAKGTVFEQTVPLGRKTRLSETEVRCAISRWLRLLRNGLFEGHQFAHALGRNLTKCQTARQRRFSRLDLPGSDSGSEHDHFYPVELFNLRGRDDKAPQLSVAAINNKNSECSRPRFRLDRATKR